MTSRPLLPGASAVLGIPDFRRLLVALFTTTLGTQIQGVVVAWQMYLDTHDPLSLGLVGLAEALPNVGTSLFAGHAADRVERRRLALYATALLLVCAVALVILAGLPGSAVRWRVMGVYTVIAISGVARAFLQPARTALGAAMVSRELQAKSVTVRSMTWQLGAVAGPAFGGLLIAAIGARASYVIVAVLLVCAIVSLAGIRFRSSPGAASAGESILSSLATGIRYLRSQEVLLAAMTLDLFSVLFGGAVALLPIFVTDILHSGPWSLGLLRSAPALGAVLTSIYLASRPPMERAGRALLFAVAAFGCFTIAFGLSREFWLSFVCLVSSGAADMVSVVIRSTLLQLLVPDHLMGRVMGVNAVFIGSSNEIGSFESGVTARLFGTVPAVLIGGTLTLVVVAVTARLAPALRTVGRLEDVGRVTNAAPASFSGDQPAPG